MRFWSAKMLMPSSCRSESLDYVNGSDSTGADIWALNDFGAGLVS